MRKLLYLINIVAALSCIVIAYIYVIKPKIYVYVYADEYKKAMFACDNVMRDHLLAKHRVITNPNDSNIQALESAELGLITCHDYDKLRKKMLMSGVSEEELALLGLEKIERYSHNIDEIVQTHEFRY